MSFTCISHEVPFIDDKARIKKYHCKTVKVVSPRIFKIVINRTNENNYNIKMGKDFYYSIIDDKINNVSDGIAVNILDKFTTKILLGDVGDTQYPLYNSNDMYLIKIQNNLVNVKFTRIMTFTEQEISVINNNIFCNIKVPIINIYGQTKVDASDIGDVIFYIQDIIEYYEFRNYKAEFIYTQPQNLKITTFFEYCPKLSTIIIGDRNTLYEKLEDLFIKYKVEIKVPFTIFYKNLFLYAMLKYVLARLLYGNFDLNYLLSQNNSKFLKKLSRSRFCSFISIFEDCNSIIYGYNKYFI